MDQNPRDSRRRTLPATGLPRPRSHRRRWRRSAEARGGKIDEMRERESCAPKRERELRVSTKRRERKLFKNYMHMLQCPCKYTRVLQQLAFIHEFTPTDVGVFLLKMCKISDFFPFYTLIHIYTSTDVDALKTLTLEYLCWWSHKFGYLALPKITLSILSFHFTKHLTSMVLF